MKILMKNIYNYKIYSSEKQNTGLITEYEKIIITTDVNFHGKKYKMFVYKKNDGVSNYIMHFHDFERDHTLNSLKALKYYSNKKKINKKDIYVLDIGSNVGWYTFYLGKYGYKIIAFEANEINNYIL